MLPWSTRRHYHFTSLHFTSLHFMLTHEVSLHVTVDAQEARFARILLQGSARSARNALTSHWGARSARISISHSITQSIQSQKSNINCHCAMNLKTNHNSHHGMHFDGILFSRSDIKFDRTSLSMHNDKMSMHVLHYEMGWARVSSWRLRVRTRWMRVRTRWLRVRMRRMYVKALQY